MNLSKNIVIAIIMIVIFIIIDTPVFATQDVSSSSEKSVSLSSNGGTGDSETTSVSVESSISTETLNSEDQSIVSSNESQETSESSSETESSNENNSYSTDSSISEENPGIDDSSQQDVTSDTITEETQNVLGENTPKLISRLRSSTTLSILYDNLPSADFIDVSSHNGNISVSDYKKLMSYGVTGVVVKLTEGNSYQNPYAENQINNAKTAGLKVSVYHYSWYTTTNEAKGEADYFANYAKKLNLPDNTLMVNDIEQTETLVASNPTNNALFFTQALSDNGFSNSMHYSYAHAFNTYFDVNAIGTANIWVADYTTPSITNTNYINYGAWQWASTMTFPNVSNGDVFDISTDYTGKFSTNASWMTLTSTDQLLSGDWNGDGIDTVSFRRDNLIYIKDSLSSGKADTVLSYGKANDSILIGDWDGDGVDTIAVRRGNRYYIKNSISSGDADIVIAYGKSSDSVLVGDWDGDGIDTLAVRRGNQYYVKNSISGGYADTVIAYGRQDDNVLVGDWDGDTQDTIAVRRNNLYYIKNKMVTGVADTVIAYGKTNDSVLIGDWDGDGVDTLTVRRYQTFYVKNSLSSGNADLVFSYN